MASPSPKPAKSVIGLNGVSAEINFIAKYIADVQGTKSQIDKDRITALLANAQADLASASQIAITQLGDAQNPGIDDH